MLCCFLCAYLSRSGLKGAQILVTWPSTRCRAPPLVGRVSAISPLLLCRCLLHRTKKARCRGNTGPCAIHKNTTECHKRSGFDGNIFACTQAKPPKNPDSCLVLGRVEVIVPVLSEFMNLRWSEPLSRVHHDIDVEGFVWFTENVKQI